MLTFKPLFGYMAYHRIGISDLAQKARVNPTHLSRAKKGDIAHSMISTIDIDKICTVLNLSVQEVIRFDPDPPSESVEPSF